MKNLTFVKLSKYRILFKDLAYLLLAYRDALLKILYLVALGIKNEIKVTTQKRL